MLISDIKDKDLRELAELRTRERGGDNENGLCEFWHAFDWSSTPEGHNYWMSVDEGLRTTK